MTPDTDIRRGGGARWVLPPALLPFAPVLYVAWADGALSADELSAVRTQALASGVDPETAALLSTWLDPASPPTPVELGRLLEAIRACAGALPEDACGSLATMGLALAAVRDIPTGRPERRALETIEDALGVAGAEAARSLLPGAAVPPAPPPGAVDGGALTRALTGEHAELRARVLRLLASSLFAYVDPHDHAAYRERVLVWLRMLAAEGLGGLGYPREFGGEHDATRAIAVFETIAHHDLSLLVKFGVQFGLFGGSILQLGTRAHHARYLADVATLALPGCFAMTEIGHGSNVRDIETTATYDPDTDEFVIHTPHAAALKDWIGNAALHGRMATVFAQLIVRGEHHGVHAFLVPIRDARGAPAPGVTIADCGAKEGLNGVDNGRLGFAQVRVPRGQLLDRFGRVSADGSYTSPIGSPTRRFFTMLGTLIAGRISIATAAVSAARSGLTIAIRYTARRRQFGPEGAPEVPVLDYLVVQRALLPALAGTVALGFATRALVRRFGVRSEDRAQELEALAAGLKALASRHAVDTLQACREACGGQGYLEANRISILRADTDVFTTFEGANDVLLQLVAKGLLTEYREQFGELRLWNVLRHVGARAATAIAERNPIATRRTDADHLRDPDFLAAALRFRETRLLDSLARRLRARIGDGEDSFAALVACQDHAVALAKASMERVVFDAFADGIDACTEADALEPLRALRSLYGLWLIERDLGWYLEKSFVEPVKAEAIRTEVNHLCREIRPMATAIVDAFGIPDALLAAPIATGENRS